MPVTVKPVIVYGTVKFQQAYSPLRSPAHNSLRYFVTVIIKKRITAPRSAPLGSLH